METLAECIGRNYVHVRFTETRGGTELGFELDRERCRLDDLDRGDGRICLVGELNLDYVPVRCVAEVDLATFQGTGRLERLDG